MKLSRRSAAHALATILFSSALLALLLSLLSWGGPMGMVLAQSVPGNEPPVSPVPTGAPVLPPVPVPISAGTPLTVTLDPAVGASVNVIVPSTTPGGTPNQVTFAISAATLQSVVDRNGNPVRAARLVVEVATPTAVPALPPGELNLGDVISVRLIDGNGNVIERPSFSPPAVVCFTPSAEQVAAAGGLGNITVRSFDSLTGQWETLPSLALSGQICASVSHLSFFVLTIVPAVVPIPVALPDTGGVELPQPQLLLGLAALLALGGMALARRTQP